MFKEAGIIHSLTVVSKFSNEVIAPRVRDMDEVWQIDI
jgi:hypothetical protein